jgi:hypothetical protein
MRTWLRRRSDEEGVAMITALLVTVVASVLGVTAIQLAVHNDEASGADRARTQAIHAAEAGLELSLQTVESRPTYLLPCTITGSLNARGEATWSASLTYYDAYPMTAASVIPCTTGGTLAGDVPARAVRVVATGSVPVTGRTVQRVMESQAQLTPLRGLFDKALYSIESPNITNNLTIWGQYGNDANFFTSGDWHCKNTFRIEGSLYVQGVLQMDNSCTVAVDAWATGNVSMYNSARIDHDVISSTGSLLISTTGSGLAIGNDAVVGTTCTGCSGKVGGTVTTNKLQGPPPTAEFPSITFGPDDVLAWEAEGWGVENFTNCGSARDWIMNPSHASLKRVVRITGGCTLTFSNNTTVTRTADLAIITDGSITTQNLTRFRSGDGLWHDLQFIVETAAESTCPTGDISFSNNTSFQQLQFFVYSPCTALMANGDSNARGQVYARVVGIQNQINYTYSPTKIPGSGDVYGHEAYAYLLREILP